MTMRALARAGPRRLSLVMVAALATALLASLVRSCSARPRPRPRPARARSGRRPPRRARRRRGHRGGRGGVKFRADVGGFVTGVRFYKGDRQHRHPRRAPVVVGRDAAGDRDVHRRDGHRLAAGQLLLAGGGHGEHDLRRLVLRANGRLLRRRRTPSPPPASTTPRCTRSRTASTAATASTATAPAAGSPPARSVHELLGGRRLQPSATDTTPPTVTVDSPRPPAPPVSPTTRTVTATFSEPSRPAPCRFTLTAAGGTAVAGTTSYDAPSSTATFTPSAALADVDHLHRDGQRRQGPAGNTMSPFSWSFTTARPGVGLPVHDLAEHDDAGTATTARQLVRSNSVCGSAATSPGSSPGSGSTRARSNTGTHVGTLWTEHRHPAVHRDVQRRDRVRLAAGRRCHRPVAGHRQHDLRRLLLTPHRLLLRQHQLLRLARWPRGAAARAGQRHRRRQRRLPLRRRRLPDRHVPVDATTGSTSSSTPAPRTPPRRP